MTKRVRLICACGLLFWIFGILFALYLIGRGEASLLLRILQASEVILPSVFPPFSWQHCLLLAATLGGAVLLVCWINRSPRAQLDGKIDFTVFFSGVVFGTMETYKQFYCLYVIGGGHYNYAQFPFQFCSLPIYACLLLPLLPECRFKQAGYRFLALFGTVGGLAVICYPRLSDHLYLYLHTIVWHILMIMLGLFLLIACNCGTDFKRDYLPTTAIFLSCFGIATLLNVCCSHLDGFQAFYMSPYEITTYVILDQIQNNVGWWLSALLFVLVFCSFGALPMWLLGKWLTVRRERRMGNTQK